MPALQQTNHKTMLGEMMTKEDSFRKHKTEYIHIPKQAVYMGLYLGIFIMSVIGIMFGLALYGDSSLLAELSQDEKIVCGLSCIITSVISLYWTLYYACEI